MAERRADLDGAVMEVMGAGGGIGATARHADDREALVAEVIGKLLMAKGQIKSIPATEATIDAQFVTALSK